MKALSVAFQGERVDLENESDDKLIAAKKEMVSLYESTGRPFPQKPVTFFTGLGVVSVSHAILQTPRIRNERIVQREDGTEDRA